MPHFPLAGTLAQNDQTAPPNFQDDQIESFQTVQLDDRDNLCGRLHHLVAGRLSDQLRAVGKKDVPTTERRNPDPKSQSHTRRRFAI